jgi:hypothetical protein
MCVHIYQSGNQNVLGQLDTLSILIRRNRFAAWQYSGNVLTLNDDSHLLQHLQTGLQWHQQARQQ